jgi:hypothetical protein
VTRHSPLKTRLLQDLIRMADGVMPLTKMLRQPDARAMAAAVAALSNLVPGNIPNQVAVRRARVYGLLIRVAAAHHGQPVAHNALKVRTRTIQTGACSDCFVLRTRGLGAGLTLSHAHSHLASHATSTDPAVAAFSRRRMRLGRCLARSCGARSRSWRRR